MDSKKFSLWLTLIIAGWLTTPSAMSKEAPNIAADVLIQTSQSWDGSILKSYPEGLPEVTILRIKVLPGVQLPLHQHPYLNAGVLLRGELTVTTVDKKTILVKAGDAIVEVLDKWHYGKNTGQEIAEIIVFYAGVAGEPITVKQ